MSYNTIRVELPGFYILDENFDKKTVQVFLPTTRHQEFLCELLKFRHWYRNQTRFYMCLAAQKQSNRRIMYMLEEIFQRGVLATPNHTHMMSHRVSFLDAWLGLVEDSYEKVGECS